MKTLVCDRGGATAIEYALVAGFISIVVVTAVSTIGSEVKTMFQATIAPFL